MNNSQRIRIKAFQRLGIAFILLLLIVSTGSASANGVISQTNGVEQQGEDPPPPGRSPQAKHDEINMGIEPLTGNWYTDIFNQMDQVSTWGIVSQDIWQMGGIWSAEAADDFTIPAADGSWTIHSVDVIGFCRDLDFNPYDCINRDNAEVNIYQDGGVVPGDRIFISFNNTITAGPKISNNVRIYTINLTTPIVLTAGSYWISVVVDMDYWGGDYLWNQREVQNGHSFAWRNPGGGWGAGCTDWCSYSGSNPDLNFRLNGVSGNPYIVPLTTGEVYAVVEHGTQPYIYASVPQSNVVYVVNSESDSIVTSIPVGSKPQGLAISLDSSRVYVALNGGNAVKVINTATNTVTDTFSLSYQPIELDYGGLGRLYVSDGNDIESLDPSNGNLVSTLPSDSYAGGVIAISPDGQTLCSSRTGSSNAAITCYDISTDSPPAPWTSTIRDDNLRNIDISGDGAYLYTAFESFCAVRAYNLSTLTQVGLFSWGGYPDYAISVYDSYLGDRVFISEAGGSWAWDAQTYLPLLILDNREVKFLGGGRDNFTAYATDSTDDTLLIYHYTSFGDLSWTHWARNWIEALYSAGLTSGYPDGTYRPQNPVTRAEMAIFLLKGMGVTPPASDGSHPFSDISGHWAEAWIEELYDQGITGGYPDGTYRPENRVTRAEMAIFLLKGIGVSPPPLNGSHPFSDISGHWAEIFIEELYDQGITGGYPDGTYRPENRVTRAEMAVFLVNAFGLPTLQVNP